jgi:hypothetical protein
MFAVILYMLRQIFAVLVLSIFCLSFSSSCEVVQTLSYIASTEHTNYEAQICKGFWDVMPCSLVDV